MHAGSFCDVAIPVRYIRESCAILRLGLPNGTSRKTDAGWNTAPACLQSCLASHTNAADVLREQRDAMGMPHIIHDLSGPDAVHDKARLHLDAADAAIVRDQLFPADAMLWRSVCRGQATSSASVAIPLKVY